ncbi:MAG: outer membrane protein assembly factor, partial [bacterium]
GMHHLGRRELKAANLKTHRPGRLPWRERPSLRMDYLRADTASIAALYRHYGFLDARARWVLESTRDPEAARVVFVIDEGQRSRIATLDLQGVNVFHEREVERVLLAQRKQPFDPAFLSLDTVRVSTLYQERGYRPHTQASAERGAADPTAVNVRYDIHEGPRYRIGRIDYESSGALREQLARRELLLRPGDFYRRSRLEQSVQRLYDTGLYSQVQVSATVDTTDSTLDLDFRLAERRPRWIDLGIGSGTAELFRFTGEWGHRNLNRNALRGALHGELALDYQRRNALDEAQVLRVRTIRTSADLVEPWLLGFRLQGRASLFYEQSNDDRDYRFLHRRRSRGVEVGLLREFSRILRANLTAHTALVNQSYDVLLETDQATRDSLSQVLDRYFDNGMGLGLTRDTRDDRVIPGRGSMQTILLEFAGGPLRGASSYEKLQFTSVWYTPRANGWLLASRVVAGVMAPIGNPSDEFSPGTVDPEVARVPKERRFFIGGVNSLRGFGENSVTGDGGLAMLLGNVEMRIPLWGPLGAEVFMDAGNVWPQASHIRWSDLVAPWNVSDPLDASQLRYSYGVGARVMLPFGPLRFDISWSEHPEFSGGQLFRRRQPFAYQFAIGPSF